jgi:hypothetical protein
MLLNVAASRLRALATTRPRQSTCTTSLSNLHVVSSPLVGNQNRVRTLATSREGRPESSRRYGSEKTNNREASRFPPRGRSEDANKNSRFGGAHPGTL